VLETKQLSHDRLPFRSSACSSLSPSLRERASVPGRARPAEIDDAAIANAVARAERKLIRHAIEKARQAEQRRIYHALGRSARRA
jgi:hypothetical protein